MAESYPYYSPASIRKFFESSGGSIRKKWGQNFLIDPNLSRKIAETLLAHCSGGILEIGPGLGVITKEYLKSSCEIHAVEIDPVLAGELQRQFSGSGNLQVYNQDAREFLLALREDEQFRSKLGIVCAGGNLPYYITSELLTGAVLIPGIKKAAFLVQKEYALRCTAEGSESSLNVFLNNFGTWKIALNAPPGAFYPVPGVHSSLLVYTSHEKAVCDPEILENILRMSFRGRRKKIKNAWAMAEGKYSLENMTAAAEKAGISTEKRPEEIQKNEYYLMAEALGVILENENNA